MSKKQKIVCIRCPTGCQIELDVSSTGDVLKVSGNECERGSEYATIEFKSPVRILTTTVTTEGSSRPLLPVKTNKPIPKRMLKECMKFLSEVKIKPPIRMGEVIVANILGTEADILSTSELRS